MKRGTPHQTVFIDPNDCKTYSLTGSVIALEKDHKYNKKNTYISYVNSTDLAKSTIELPQDIDEDEIESTVSELVYEDLKLDPEAVVSIKYEAKGMNFDGTKTEYNAYALEEKIIESDFANCIDKTPYIDYIIPTPFLYSALYEAGVLPKEGTHAFCHFGMRDSLFLLFEDGKLLYYRNLQNNLPKFFEYFNSITFESIDIKTFGKLLSGQISDINHDKALKKTYEDVCMSLEEILIYVKRIFSVGTLDRFYIENSFGFSEEFYVHSSDYLMTTVQSFDFNYGYQQNDGITQLGMMSLLAAREYDKGVEDTFNYTLYQKPKPFAKRDAGIMIMLTAASFLIAFAYPVYNYVNILSLKENNLVLRQKNSNVQLQASQIRNEIMSLEQEKKDTLERLSFSQKETERQFRILYDIYDRQSNYATKTDMIIELIREITSTGVKLDHFSAVDKTDNNHVQMLVNSRNHDKLAELIYKLERNQRYAVAVNEIKQDENRTHFFTSINLVLQ